MLIKNLYLRIRLFLYSKREILNKITLFIMISAIFYILLNSFFFGKIIIGKADINKIDREYKSAINFYTFAYFYYNLNHSAGTNKINYLELPYKISICYLQNNNPKKANETMLNAMAKIQKQYGFSSTENASFIRKYLIEYYFLNNNLPLAKQSFNNLLTIYKKIGYNQDIMADLTRLAGDLYYQEKNYDTANAFYEKSFDIISKQTKMDYEIYTKIVDKMCDYQVKTDNIENAIQLYNDSILILKDAYNQNEALAATYIKLGNLYNKDDGKTEDSIQCYEQALNIIKTLPRNSYFRRNINTYYLILKELYNNNGQSFKASEIDVELARRRRFEFLN